MSQIFLSARNILSVSSVGFVVGRVMARVNDVDELLRRAESMEDILIAGKIIK